MERTKDLGEDSHSSTKRRGTKKVGKANTGKLSAKKSSAHRSKDKTMILSSGPARQPTWRWGLGEGGGKLTK